MKTIIYLVGLVLAVGRGLVLRLHELLNREVVVTLGVEQIGGVILKGAVLERVALGEIIGLELTLELCGVRSLLGVVLGDVYLIAA